MLAGIFVLWGIILIPGVIITTYANRLITEKLHANNKNFLYATYMSADSELSSAFTKVNGLFEQNSGDYYTLLKLENKTSQEITLPAYRLYSDFKQSQLNDGFFESTFLYFPKSDLVITSEGTYAGNFFFEKKMIFENYEGNYFKSLAAESFSSRFCPATSVRTKTVQNSSGISYTAVIPVAVKPAEAKDAEGIFVFLIDEEKLNSFFETLNLTRSSYIYLQNMDTGEILNSPAEEKYEQLLELDALTYRKNSQSLKLTEGKEKYTLLWKNSSVARLRYILVEPELLITKQIRNFSYLTMIVTLAALLLSGAVLGLYSRYLHKNIRDMLGWLTRASEGKGSKAEGSGLFLNIPDLKEAVEILCVQHENSRPYLIQAFLGRSVQELLTKDELEYFQREFPEFQDGCFFRMYLRKPIEGLQNRSGSGENADTPQLEQQERNEQSDYLLEIPKEQVEMLYLTAATAEELKEKENRIVPETAGICARSVVFRSIRDNYRCFHQTLGLLDYYGIAKEKQVYDMEDMLDSAENKPLTREEKNRVFCALKKSSSEAADCVAEILCGMKERNISFCQFKSNVKELLYLLQESMYEQQISYVNTFSPEGKEIMNQADRMIRPEELETLCVDTYRKIPDTAAQKDIVSQAEQTLLRYIDDHLPEINLTMMADATGMNQNYLSQYFKKHFEISFMDYVTGKKIQRAKELLVTTDDTCKAIGEQLGYSAQNAFIRAFKKSEGITPAEYRQKNKGQLL